MSLEPMRGESQHEDRYLDRTYSMLSVHDDKTGKFHLTSMLIDGRETIEEHDRRGFSMSHELMEYWHATSRGRIEALADGQAVAMPEAVGA